MLSELLSLMVVISLPSIGLMLLYRWAGRTPALLSAVLQLLFDAMFLGSTFMWMAFLMTLFPLAVLIRNENRPFAVQMRASIAAFGAGVLAAIALLYMRFGGNMIERMLLTLPEAARSIPQETLALSLESVSAILGETVTPEGFYERFDNMIRQLIPYYQMNLPGLIFSGALVTAVLCVGVSGLMRHRRGQAQAGSYLPLREWALPASTTGGLLLIVALSYALDVFGMRDGATVFATVYAIAVTAFCVQALASVARRLHAMPMKHGVRVASVSALGALCLLGGADIIALYGCLSAIFGSRGALRQRMNGSTNDHSDGGDAGE